MNWIISLSHHAAFTVPSELVAQSCDTNSKGGTQSAPTSNSNHLLWTKAVKKCLRRDLSDLWCHELWIMFMKRIKLVLMLSTQKWILKLLPTSDKTQTAWECFSIQELQRCSISKAGMKRELGLFSAANMADLLSDLRPPRLYLYHLYSSFTWLVIDRRVLLKVYFQEGDFPCHWWANAKTRRKERRRKKKKKKNKHVGRA